MQISLFVNTAEKERMDKTSYITNRFPIDGFLKRNTSVINPVIEIEKTSNPITYNYNYMYIGEFKRYYFITDIVNVSKNRWEIHGKVDPLFSLIGDIRACSVILDKAESENNANLYMNDGSFVMDSRKYNEIKRFPSGLNENGSYILICAGGV